MDVMLQHHGAKRIYPIPEGLRELCTDISREVLRSQPSHIYRFLAEYVEALLISRENAKVAARILSEILDETVSYESAWKRRGLTMDEVTHAAITIQAAYRGFITRKYLRAVPSELDNLLLRCGVSWSVANRVCSIIQAAYRGHLERRKYRSHKATCELLAKLGIEAHTAHQAAIIIQAAFRGYRARLYVKSHTVPDDIKGLSSEERLLLNRFLIKLDLRWSQANIAAISIQNAYRKRMEYLKEQEAKESEDITEAKDKEVVKLYPKESSEIALRIISSLILRATESDHEIKSRIGEPLHKATEAGQITEEILDVLISEVITHLFELDMTKLLAKFGTDIETATRACTVIQAAYRGHLARRYVKEHTVPEDSTMSPEEKQKMNKHMISMNIKWDKANIAAKFLQSVLRKKMSGKREGESDEQLKPDAHPVKSGVMFRTESQELQRSTEALEGVKAETEEVPVETEQAEVAEEDSQEKEHGGETESVAVEEGKQLTGDEMVTEGTEQPSGDETVTEETKPSGDEAVTEGTEQPSEDVTATEETKPTGDETVTEETVQPPGDGTVAEETVQPPGDETVAVETEQPPGDETVAVETEQPPGDGTGTEETKPTGDETVAEETEQPPGDGTVATEEEKGQPDVSAEDHTGDETAPPDEDKGQTESAADTEPAETVTSSTEPPSTTEPEDTEVEG